MARSMAIRIALIHGLRASVDPIQRAFAKIWPEARLCNILDDSLSRDRLEGGDAAVSLPGRFLDLTHYALKGRPQAILFTCSAFGPEIDACIAAHPEIPILKPNEAMIEAAARLDRPVALFATFAPTLQSMVPEFCALAPDLVARPVLIDGALAALEQGDPDRHDALAVTACADLKENEVVALAQFSLARAAPAIAAATGRTVLTTPDSAALKLRRLLVGE